MAATLEDEYRDMVDIEFTVESGRLFMLQCRAGKRAPRAAVRIAVDLAEAGRIDADEALRRVTAEHIDALAGATRVEHHAESLAQGVGASPGVVHGYVARDFDEVAALTAEGKNAILVTTFTAPDDVPTMFASAGVLTEVGGATSHAALVCREIGLPCVVGAGPGLVDRLAGLAITIDGETGKVYAEGAVGTTAADEDRSLAALAALAESAGDTEHPVLRLAGA